ncbi:MAG: GGDEF domain-containing protein, partial [Candidatus Eremiobacteraeota bacterium]|nr:GGDEF domain-containing protein [Candidatus Eremiobacteraeota bacterium]
MTRPDRILATSDLNDWRSLNARVIELEGERSDARDQARLLSALHDTFARITATRDVDEIIGHMLRAAYDPLGFSRAIYFAVAPGGEIEAKFQIDGSDRVEPSTEIAELGPGSAMSRVIDGDDSEGVGMAGELSAPLVDVRGWYVMSVLSQAQRTLGILYTDGHASRIPRDWEARLLASLTAIGAVSIANSILFATTHELALRDPLTGLYNRRAFSERLATEFEAMRRHGRALTYVMIDVDDFKKINDEHGHGYGDAVLKKLAQTLSDSSRKQDVVGRYAGDEFVVLLVDVEHDVAKTLVSRLSTDLKSAGLSCSLGAASAPRD